MKRLLFLQCLVVLVGHGCWSQMAPNREKGVLFSVTARYNDTIHLIHLPNMPYYEPIRRPLTVPGWQFNNPSLDFLSLDIDFRAKTLFMFERETRVILAATGYKAPVTPGSFRGPIYYLDLGVSNGAIQLSYDWQSQTLYWVDSSLRWIAATSGDMVKFVATQYETFNFMKVLVETDLEHPEGLAVDPFEGLLFFCDNGRHPKIEVVNTDGTGRKTLLGSGVGRPESMEVDHTVKRVYWVDMFKETIDYMNYDGTGRGRLQLFHGTFLSDLAIFRDVLAVVDSGRGRAYFVNKTSGAELIDSVEFKKDYLYGVCIYNIDNQPLKTYSGQNCTELDCHHLCISTATNPKCMCYDGYVTNTSAPNRCQPKDGGYLNAIVIAVQNYIYLADVRTLNVLNPTFYGFVPVFSMIDSFTTTTTTTTTPPPPNTTVTPPPSTTPYIPEADPIHQIAFIDLNIQERTVYIASMTNTIYSRPLEAAFSNPYKEFILTATGKIAGIVFDWVNKNNLYWIQSDTKTLHRVDLTTKSSQTLGNGLGSGEPSNLRLLYRERRLAWWSMSTLSEYTLKTANLQGGDMKTIISGRNRVKSLTVDDQKEIFYWIEADYIMALSFNLVATATGVRRVVQSRFNGPEILLQYKNLLTWAKQNDASGGVDIEAYSVDVAVQEKTGTFSTVGPFKDMKILDRILISDKLTNSNLCSFQNGGCEQTCIMAYQNTQNPTKQCGCTLGYTLDSNLKTCSSSPISNNFALVTDITYGRIYQIDLNSGNLHALDYIDTAIYNNVFFDRKRLEVIWSDSGIKDVYSAKLNGDNLRLRDARAFYNPGDIAVDYTTGNMYYAENYPLYDAFVRVVTPQGYGFQFISNTMMYQDSISAIDVHPQNGWLYMAVNSGIQESYVLRSNMDGTNIMKFPLKVPGLRHPVIQGLVIDHNMDMVYYSESTQDKIWRCDLDFKMCKLFFTAPVRPANIRHIDTDGDYVYYASYQAHHLQTVRISDGRLMPPTGSNVEMGKLFSVSVYKENSKNIQKDNDRCKDRNGRGDCSTICFPTETGRTCACEFNITLNEDKRTCSNVQQCGLGFLDGDNRQISVTPDCLRYENESCEYTCPSGFAPSNDNNHKVWCIGGAWNRSTESLCKPVPCSGTIPNGKVAEGCSITVNGACSYDCYNGYYKSQGVADIVCTGSGSWNQNPCTNERCPTSIPDGTVDRHCNRQINSRCGYTCRDNFKPRNANIQSLLCGKVNNVPTWSPNNDLCEEILCPGTVEHGVIDVACFRGVGRDCSFSCLSGFPTVSMVTRVVCMATGMWNQSTDLCTAPPPSVTSGQTSDNATAIGVGVGVAVGLIAIAALILLFIYCRGRQCGVRKESKLPSASFSNEPVGGIENPGYLTADIRVTNDNNDHYDQPSMASNPNFKKDNPYSKMSDTGTVRSADSFYYGNETLPDKKEIESPTSTSDKAQLTSVDNWLNQNREGK